MKRNSLRNGIHFKFSLSDTLASFFFTGFFYETWLPSKEDAADWMDRNQLGRRNLHPDAFTLLLGRRYNRQKKAAHRPENKGLTLSPLKTSDKLAKEHGVSRETVKRAGKFAAAIEKTKAITPDIESRVATGKTPPKAAVVKVAARGLTIMITGKVIADGSFEAWI